MNPQVALERFIDEYASYASLSEKALLSVEILTEAKRNATIAGVFEKNRDRLIGVIVDRLKEGAKTGVFSSYSDENAVACLVLDTLEGHGLRSLTKSAKPQNKISSLRTFLMNGLKS